MQAMDHDVRLWALDFRLWAAESPEPTAQGLTSTHKRLAFVVRIRPPVVRNQRCPPWPRRILIVGIRAEFAIQIFVLGQLLPIEPHAQTRTIWHSNRALLVLELPAFNEVIFEMVIVRIGRKPKIRYDSAEVKHRRQLHAELARRVDGDAELECVAYTSSLHAGPDAA